MKAFITLTASALLVIGSLAFAQSTRPTGERGRAAMLETFREAVTKLDLTEDQKQKVREILTKASEELQSLREKARGDGAGEARAKVRQIMQDTREQISQLLSPEQQQKLRDLMQQNVPSRNEQSKPAPEPKQPACDDAMSPNMNEGIPKMDEGMQQMQPEGRRENRAEPSKPKVLVDEIVGHGPAAGSSAPDFKLQKLDGSTVQLAGFKGKLLVITFGSYTCPTFRERASQFEELKKQASSANYLFVYTKEAHPQGVWDVARNKDEDIAYPQHADAKARESMAKLAKDKLGLTGAIALDSMDDAMIKAYGGFPNGTVIVGRDGRIFARQAWTDPSGVKRLIDEAMSARSTTQAQ